MKVDGSLLKNFAVLTMSELMENIKELDLDGYFYYPNHELISKTLIIVVFDNMEEYIDQKLLFNDVEYCSDLDISDVLQVYDYFIESSLPITTENFCNSVNYYMKNDAFLEPSI